MSERLMNDGASDEVLLAELGRRLSRERLQRNLTQARLAEEAGVSLSTVRRLEAGQGSNLVALLRVLRALGLLANLEALVPRQPPSPLRDDRDQGPGRRRASPTRDAAAGEPGDEPPSGPWVWGEDR